MPWAEPSGSTGMIIASNSWELTLPGCTSLKEKRSVIRSLKDRLRVRYHLSVAETGMQDVHGRAVITVAVVAGDRRQAESILDKADRLVENEGRALIVSSDRQFY